MAVCSYDGSKIATQAGAAIAPCPITGSTAPVGPLNSGIAGKPPIGQLNEPITNHILELGTTGGVQRKGPFSITPSAPKPSSGPSLDALGLLASPPVIIPSSPAPSNPTPQPSSGATIIVPPGQNFTGPGTSAYGNRGNGPIVIQR